MSSEERDQCIFCRIIDNKMESQKVYDDGTLTAVLDINPVVKGHTVLMSNEHVPIMPVIPPNIFVHQFGMLPKICKALKESLLTTGINIFIANGAVAGQNSPHFLIHLYPREKGDGLFKFYFQGQPMTDDSLPMLANNLPIMMNNHFARSPATWRNTPITTSTYLQTLKQEHNLIYEDQKVMCIAPKNPLCKGHMILYSQEEPKLIEQLSFESSAHLFYVASYAATAVFEGLGAHASNIILLSGTSEDNPQGILQLHILPRWQDDGLDLIHEPMKDPPDIKVVAEKIKDKTFYVEYEVKNPSKQQEKITEQQTKQHQSTPPQAQTPVPIKVQQPSIPSPATTELDLIRQAVQRSLRK